MRAGRVLPPGARGRFKEPVGRDIAAGELPGLSSKHTIITVGDVVSLTARENGVTPLLSVYDGRTERRGDPRFARLVEGGGEEPVPVANPAGTISAELEDAVRNALAGKAPTVIRVDGEEDLALLPCVLYAPEGAVVVYGWPGRGMKAVDTDGPARHHVEELMGMMEEQK